MIAIAAATDRRQSLTDTRVKYINRSNIIRWFEAGDEKKNGRPCIFY